ncbi:LAQU0S02e08614g1_1 [Lachancea quebecensis]|uniref:LAQU0S02e08614g1_1 n=1 Tax=Lachancea quebecensis TaxID=1654605 RepID=A0A0P1KNY3_9SACH|nr:LAQU0S02e08614g1_1 [Lachancea quebecensis]
MVLHFSCSTRHRTFVLHWYRYTLRNVNRQTFSWHLKARVKDITRITLVKHKSDKSSWSVYTLLRDLRTLNGFLRNKKTAAAWRLLTLYSKKSPKTQTSPPSTALQQSPPLQDPETVRNNHIIHSYVAERQQKNLLPQEISAEYKTLLLLPLALHYHSLKKLHIIESKLAQGPPKVSVNYTSAGKARIWFLRTAVNKNKRQSKALGQIIRREKRKSQKNLDYWEKCRVNGIWAWHEAAWEHLMETNTVLTGSPAKYFDAERTRKHIASEDTSLKAVAEWLDPVFSSLDMLQAQSAEQAAYFEKYKHNTVLQGQQQYFARKSDKMYENRKKRFKSLLEDDLPFVTPYFCKRNLAAVMKSHKF